MLLDVCTYVSKDKLSEEFKALTDWIGWRRCEEIPVVLIFKEMAGVKVTFPRLYRNVTVGLLKFSVPIPLP